MPARFKKGVPNLWLGEVFGQEVGDLRLGRDETDIHALSPEGPHEPMNRDAMRSRHMAQGAGATLRKNLDHGVIIFC